MGKRGQNEGSIHKREDGRWCAILNLGYENGKRKRKYFYGDTRKEVADQLTVALREKQQGILATGPRQTVVQYLNNWLHDVARHTLRASTFESYERLIRPHIVPVIGRESLQKLSPQHLQALYGKKLSEGLSPRTVQYMHAVLHRALEQAVRWNLIARNPADLVDPPRPRRQEIHPLTTAQIGQLLEAAKGDRFYALYMLAVTTGLRQGELLGLRWADIDLQSATLFVRQQVGRTKTQGMTFSEPKTAKGRRSVSLPVIALEPLKQRRIAQLEERLLAGSEWEDHDLVFSNCVGRPLDRPNLQRRSFIPLLEKAGLPRIRFHDLRHSAATLLLSQGVHPKVVQERLGHSTIGVTMDVYSHVLPELQREAADKIDALFGTG